MELLKNNKITNIVKILVGLAILALLVVGIKSFMKDFSFSLLDVGLKHLSPLGFLIIIIMGLIAFFPMCFYDYFIKKKLDFKISIKNIFKYGWIINAVTIVAGLGDAAGISLRAYFYRDEMKEKKILLKEVSKISLLNPSGLSILAIIYLIFYVRGQNIFTLGNISAFIIALYIPAILIYNFIKNKKEGSEKEYKYIFSIVLVSFLDWALSTFLFFLILRVLGTGTGFSEFFPIYVIAMILGIVSMLPGAVGAFDLSMIIGLTAIGVPNEFALLSVFLYRVAYYIFPLGIAGVLFIIELWKNATSKTREVVSLIIGKSSFIGLRILIFISGLALLLSNAFPRVLHHFKEIEFLSHATEMHFSKSLVIVVGFLLLIMAGLLKYKVKSIYYLTVGFLIVGTLFSIIKSFNYITVSYLIIVAIVLILSKKEFNKKSFIIEVEAIIINIFILSAFWILYLIVAYMNIPFKMHGMPKVIRVFIHSYRNLVSFSTIGYILGICILVIFYFIGKYKNKIPHNTLKENEGRIREILKNNNGTSLTHLVYLNDKYVYLSDKYEGMIQYAVYSNKLVVLGNPIGNLETLKEFIEEFYDFADQHGYIPIFFEVSGDMLEILHEFGYEFMKLGEAAIVDVEDFTIAGQKMQKVRTCCNKINREGYSFEVLEGPFSDEIIKEVKEISNEWLHGRKEMGFSMGFFDESYINNGPMGLVRNKEGRLRAFVTVMPTYGENKTFCSDLMRFSKDTPRGVMDYMFVNLIEWGKGQNYKYFNFGVAPLSNVGISKYSFLSERLAYQIYYYGKKFYSFEGLKKFKAKYAHFWEPKFLAYKNKKNLPITALQANLIVSMAPKRKENLEEKK